MTHGACFWAWVRLVSGVISVGIRSVVMHDCGVVCGLGTCSRHGDCSRAALLLPAYQAPLMQWLCLIRVLPLLVVMLSCNVTEPGAWVSGVGGGGLVGWSVGGVRLDGVGVEDRWRCT